MSEYTLQQLSHKIDQLIAECERLRLDNADLQRREHEWSAERTQLVEKNDLARNRVEDMIRHLKSLKEGVV